MVSKEALCDSLLWKLRLGKASVFLKVTEDNCSRVRKLSLNLVPVCDSSCSSPVSSTPILYYFDLPVFLLWQSLAATNYHRAKQIVHLSQTILCRIVYTESEFSLSIMGSLKRQQTEIYVVCFTSLCYWLEDQKMS